MQIADDQLSRIEGVDKAGAMHYPLHEYTMTASDTRATFSLVSHSAIKED